VNRPRPRLRARSRSRDACVVGGALVVLGAFAVVEGRRLYELRESLVAGAIVGDDTFPLVVGIALIALGVYLVIAAPPPAARITLPSGPVRTRMLVGAGLLVLYWLVVPRLGYTAATALVSAALFRGMGGYRWPAAALLAALTTGALYLLFRVWLLQPLPAGLLGG
jgi:hypothetical protein